jgi:hypothetical protein
LATPTWRSKEIILKTERVLELDTSAKLPALNGKLDIGLANSGNIIYNTVSWIQIVIQFNIVFSASSSAVLLDYNLGNIE